jgi:nucleoside-diphosphate-sugar epimerase
MRNHGLQVRVGRFHNIYGPEGSWNNGKEKAPAAICRKVAEAQNEGSIDIWGDGKQTRSFLYVDECVEAVLRFMKSDFCGPVNIGSEEMIAINDLARMVIDISGKNITINNIAGPLGVRGRNSDNNVFREKIGWESTETLSEGMKKTYNWIAEQVAKLSATNI